MCIYIFIYIYHIYIYTCICIYCMSIYIYIHSNVYKCIFPSVFCWSRIWLHRFRTGSASAELQDQALFQAFDLERFVPVTRLPLDCGWLCLMTYTYGIQCLNKWRNPFQLNAVYFTNKEKRILEMAKVKQNLQYLALHKGEFSLRTTEVWHSLLIRISISSHLRTYSKHICVFYSICIYCTSVGFDSRCWSDFIETSGILMVGSNSSGSLLARAERALWVQGSWTGRARIQPNKVPQKHWKAKHFVLVCRMSEHDRQNSIPFSNAPK